MKKQDIFKDLEDSIFSSKSIDEKTKSEVLKKIARLKNCKVNIMITGATGCGKSSTINALFGTEKAKVGTTPDPETMSIEKYELSNLVIWDSPGLGDGKEKDITHAKNIIKKLNELDENNKALIDIVLVILDGGSRDLGTSYELINNIIIPNLGENKDKRILIALNQCDMAMKGVNWDYDNSVPNEKLIKFLDEKVLSVKKRIKEATGVDVDPIYYSAGYKEEGEEQAKPYNLSKLLYYIMKNTPKEKRLVVANNTNKEKEMWQSNDEVKNYNNEIKKSLIDSVVDGIESGADTGGDIGRAIAGSVGEAVGRVVGGVVGGAVGAVKSVISGLFSWW